jgi:hypothetical protein
MTRIILFAIQETLTEHPVSVKANLPKKMGQIRSTFLFGPKDSALRVPPVSVRGPEKWQNKANLPVAFHRSHFFPAT